MQRLIAPSPALGYSQFYLDFLAGKSSARKFFLSQGPAATALEIDKLSYPRTQIIDILKRQNKEYGSSPAAMAAIEKLSDPRAVCVIAGQQAGLFTQCTMVQLKAIGAAKRAAILAKELGRPVVPIFWIAGDDHDFAEVAQAGVIDQTGAFEIIKYTQPQEISLPVGMIKFSNEEGLAGAKEKYRKALGETQFSSDLYQLVEQSYTTGDTFVTAFGKMMAAMTADFDIVYFSPTDPEVSTIVTPFYQQTVEQNEKLRAAVHAANTQIIAEGYSLQVEKSDSATHLFYTGALGRTPVTVADDSCLVEGKPLSISQCRELTEKHPESFTPDVILRPVMQSYLFPVVVQIGGPAEIAYLAQVNPLFGFFGLPVPVHLPRPSVSLVERKNEKTLLDMGITVEDILGDVEQVINRVLGASFPKELETVLARSREETAGVLERLIPQVVSFDPGLGDFARQIAGKVDFSMKGLEEKVFTAHKRKSKETRDKIYRLEAVLHPLRGLQDRALNIGYFISKYGFGVVSFLYHNTDIDQTGHQLLYLSEMKD